MALTFAHRQHQQHGGDRDQHDAPDEIDVDPERPRVDRAIAEQAVAGEQRAHYREHQPERNADVQLHQKNTTLRTRIAASTIAPSTAGRWCQGSRSSCGFSVSEYTRPARSRSGRGAVIRLTA